MLIDGHLLIASQKMIVVDSGEKSILTERDITSSDIQEKLRESMLINRDQKLIEENHHFKKEENK